MLAYKFDSLQAAKQSLLTQIKFLKKFSMGIFKFISVVFLVSFIMGVLIPNSFQLCLALTGNETDRLALLEIKSRITDDPFGVMSSWNETIYFCHWRGVKCGRRHERVTMLALNSSKLAGSISPHVGNLSFLRVMLLYNNSFSHVIPPEIGRLRRLQVLRLENNSLSGEIPSNLSACSQLLEIDVSSNFLVGGIPEELGYLSKLLVLTLSRNSLTGSVPLSFRNLSSLEYLAAMSNNLNGSVPDIFRQLTNFILLDLDGNRLSGVIPPSVYNLSSIRFFSVQVNKIQGTLPANIGIAFPNLYSFRISHNQFSGSIPVSISNASNLVDLAMSRNQLYGSVPSLENLHRLQRLILGFNHFGNEEIGDLSFLCDLTNATRLEILIISVNNFGGMLPQCTANLSSSLLYFYAASNKISGSIPNGIGNLLNLQILNLFDNQFSGHIPPDIGKLQKLVELGLSNSLSGNIPSSFGNLSQLNKLHLDGNKLQGNLPSTLAECHYLEVLVISNNNLSGIVPPELIGLSSPYIHLDISQNHLTGSLPIGIGHLINLEYLNISGNMLSGDIPASLGGCIKIETLDMQGNFFQGPIPSSFSSLRGIEELDLSCNNLSDTIPEFLEHFVFLHSLNLSYNNFEGMVPTKGVFKNASATSVEGNSKLCGGIPEFQLPKCKFQHPKRRGLSQTLKLVLCLVCGLLGVTFSLGVLYFCCSRRERNKQASSSDSENFLKVSYQSLLKATDGFSSRNLIGAGSFGSVYKGVLDQGETTIAVKVLNLVHRGASKSFLAECEALRNIRHRNILKVLSACSGVNSQGDDFKALIYEFMVNGSLDEWLRPTQAVAETIERPKRSLSFSQRLNIAIDVSMALDYLHHHCETPIVHCDLKPSNVLLNDDMVGHVGDFGLVRFLPRTSGNQSSSIGVKGTIGYAPPEYGMGNEVWTQGDVYSFGILLLEMFTGKRPTDNMFQETSSLRNFVKEALPKQVTEIVDPVLVQENVEAAFVKIEDSLISILEVGVACSAELPRERLDISDVVAEMCRIRSKLEAN